MSKNLVRNEEELYRQIMPRVKKAVDYVMERIEQENYKDIEKFLYSTYQPTVYDRTRGFEYAWSADEAKQHSHTVEAEFGYDPSDIASDPDNFIHGSPLSGDSRAYLADIIYDGVWGSLFGDGPWQRKSRAFDHLVETLDKSKFDQWMKAGMKQAGLWVE